MESESVISIQHCVDAQDVKINTGSWIGNDLGGPVTNLVPANKVKQISDGLVPSDLEFGEKIVNKFIDVECQHNNKLVPSYKGSLILTNYKVIFKPILEFGQNALQ